MNHSLVSWATLVSSSTRKHCVSQHAEYRDVQSYDYFSHHSHAEAAAFTSWLSEKGVPPFHGFRIKKAVKESILKTAHQAILPAAGLGSTEWLAQRQHRVQTGLLCGTISDLEEIQDLLLEILDRTPLMYLSWPRARGASQLRWHSGCVWCQGAKSRAKRLRGQRAVRQRQKPVRQ